MNQDARIARLEGSVRTLRIMVFGLLIAAGAATVVAQGDTPVADLIRAKQIELVDGNDITRCTLKGGFIRIRDKKGESAIILGVGDTLAQSFISLKNRNGREVVQIESSFEGNGAFKSRDSQGQELVRITDGIRAKEIDIVNDKKKLMVHLGSAVPIGLEKRGGVIHFYDEGGTGQMSLQAGNGIYIGSLDLDTPRINLGCFGLYGLMSAWGPGVGKKIFDIDVSKGGGGLVRTMDGKGQPLVELGSFKSGTGGVFTYNGNGEEAAHITDSLGKP